MPGLTSITSNFANLCTICTSISCLVYSLHAWRAYLPPFADAKFSRLLFSFSPLRNMLAASQSAEYLISPAVIKLSHSSQRERERDCLRKLCYRLSSALDPGTISEAPGETAIEKGRKGGGGVRRVASLISITEQVTIYLPSDCYSV